MAKVSLKDFLVKQVSTEDAKVPESKLAKYIKTQQKSSNKTLEFDEDYKA